MPQPAHQHIVRTLLRLLTIDQKLQLLRHALKNSLPVAPLPLAEQPHAWIPGTVLTVQEPAPFRWELEVQPNRDPHGAGQVCDGAIAGNDQIETVHDRCRIHESAGSFIQVVTQIDHAKMMAAFP